MTQPQDHLTEKSDRYRRLLSDALSKTSIVPDRSSHLHTVAEDYLLMAESYYNDGVHFLDGGDRVNALVAFSYGHAFIDAGIRLGVFCEMKQSTTLPDPNGSRKGLKKPLS